MKQKLMGVDLGTGGCKATIIDENGTVLGVAFQEYPSSYPHPGWSEQNPIDWIKAFVDTVKECLALAGVPAKELAALAITASTHNAVLVDEAGEFIRPCIMWNDQRSQKQSLSLKETYGKEIFAMGMQMPTPTWTMPQLLWIRENEPDNYGRIKKIYFTKDYVRNFVTEEWSTDIVDAQGSLLFDARAGQWSPALCGMIGLPVDVLPPVKLSKQIVGTVQKRASTLTGLPEGLPVIAGCSDTASEDFGSGAVRDGQVIVKMATAGNVNLICNEARPNEKSYTYPHAVEGMWYSVLGTNTCAASYRWLRDSLYEDQKQDPDVYRLMDRKAAQIPPGADGLLFHPYLLGERCPYFNADLSASFFGVTMRHTRAHFTRAVLEGVAFSLYDCFQIVKQANPSVNEVRLIGGGAKSGLWSQILCDVFGVAALRLSRDDSSFGGALLAGVGVGIFSSEVEAADRCVTVQSRLTPDAGNHERYERLFQVYQTLVRDLTPTYSMLRNLTRA